MSRFKPTNSFLSPFSFSLVYDVWLHGFKPASLPFSFFHVHAEACACIWITSGHIFTVYKLLSILSPHFFFPGKPLHSYSKVPLVALNSGSQPLSCTIMVLPFNQLPWPYPRSSAWGPDEASPPCPALMFISLHDCMFFWSNQNNLMSMQNQVQGHLPQSWLSLYVLVGQFVQT